jgi:hypothetical protein
MPPGMFPGAAPCTQHASLPGVCIHACNTFVSAVVHSPAGIQQSYHRCWHVPSFSSCGLHKPGTCCLRRQAVLLTGVIFTQVWTSCVAGYVQIIPYVTKAAVADEIWSFVVTCGDPTPAPDLGGCSHPHLVVWHKERYPLHHQGDPHPQPDFSSQPSAADACITSDMRCETIAHFRGCWSCNLVCAWVTRHRLTRHCCAQQQYCIWMADSAPLSTGRQLYISIS